MVSQKCRSFIFGVRGISLVEVISSVVIFTFIAIGVIASFRAITNFSTRSKLTKQQISIAKDELNKIRAISKVEPKKDVGGNYINYNYENLQNIYPITEQLVTYEDTYNLKDGNGCPTTNKKHFQVYRKIISKTINSGLMNEYKEVTVTLRDSLSPERFSPLTLATNITKPVVYDKREVKDYGNLAGVVKDKDTGNPIGGVTVNAAGADNKSDDTDGEGKYSIENLKVGTYSVSAGKAKYWEEKQSSVEIKGGCVTTNLDFALQPYYHGKVKVTVTNKEDVKPIEGAEVKITEKDSGKVVTIQNPKTDANGIFGPFELEIYEKGQTSSQYKVETLANTLFWGSETIEIVTITKDQTEPCLLQMVPKKFAWVVVSVKDTENQALNKSNVKLKGNNITGEWSQDTGNTSNQTTFKVTLPKNGDFWNGTYKGSKTGYKTSLDISVPNNTLVKDTTGNYDVLLAPNTLSADINPAVANLTVGSKITCTASVKYNGDEIKDVTDTATKSWKLDSTNYGYLGAGGDTAGNTKTVTFTAIKNGTASLTLNATYDGLNANCSRSITVGEPPLPPEYSGSGPYFYLVLSPISANLTLGKSQKFTVTPYYYDGANTTLVSVDKSWSIAPANIGSLDDKDKNKDTANTDEVTFYANDEVGTGIVTVSAVYDGNPASASAAITVTSLALTVKIAPTSATVVPNSDMDKPCSGGQKTFTAKAYYGSEDVTDSKLLSFSWELLNEHGKISPETGNSTTFTANNDAGAVETLELTGKYNALDGEQKATAQVQIGIKVGSGWE